jgi:microcystin-dependent protein
MSTFLTVNKVRYAMCTLAMCSALNTTPAAADSEPFIGDIMLFAGNFCPRGWANAEGQLLAVAQNDALFSLYGTMYGGDGRTTFGLPDLRGRIPVGDGSGPGLSDRPIGEKSGDERFIMNASTLGAHTHSAQTSSTLHASSAAGNSPEPDGKVLANDGGDDVYLSGEIPDVTMASDAANSTTTVASTGQSALIEAQQAYIGIRYCVALFGDYPSRN